MAQSFHKQRGKDAREQTTFQMLDSTSKEPHDLVTKDLYIYELEFRFQRILLILTLNWSKILHATVRINFETFSVFSACLSGLFEKLCHLLSCLRVPVQT